MTAMITIPEAKEALLRSGYLLEQRIELVLRRRGWYVRANDAFFDKETNKSRELDIYALKAEKLRRRWRDGFIWAVLLAECVNNKEPLAFITKRPHLAPLHYENIKLAGLPVKVFNPKLKKWISLPAYLDMDEYHHYCKGKIATQFCSFTQKKQGGQWMATHDDLHFDAFRSLVTAVEYASNKFFESWRFDRRMEYVNIEFYYPAVVVQGTILEVHPTGNTVDIKEINHAQYQRSSIWNGEEKEYQIDVVTEKFFPSYIGKVQKELEHTAELMRRPSRRLLIQNSLEKLVNKAKRHRNPHMIREVMDYKWGGLEI